MGNKRYDQACFNIVISKFITGVIEDKQHRPEQPVEEKYSQATEILDALSTYLNQEGERMLNVAILGYGYDRIAREVVNRLVDDLDWEEDD